MKFSKLSRNMHVRDLVIQLFVESLGLLNNAIAKVCNLSITFFSTMGYLFIGLVSSWYLYLLFDDTNSLKWEEWVFDTGASPLFQRDVEREFFVVDKPGNIVRSQTNLQPVHASELYYQNYLFQILVNGKGYKEYYRKLFVLLFCKWCWALTASSC